MVNIKSRDIAERRRSQLHLGGSVKLRILHYYRLMHVLYMRLFALFPRLHQVTHHSRLFSIYFKINADNWIEPRIF
jgi:hypothetical protein